MPQAASRSQGVFNPREDARGGALLRGRFLTPVGSVAGWRVEGLLGGAWPAMDGGP